METFSYYYLAEEADLNRFKPYLGFVNHLLRLNVLAPQVRNRKLSGFSSPLVEEHKEFGMCFPQK